MHKGLSTCRDVTDTARVCLPVKILTSRVHSGDHDIVIRFDCLRFQVDHVRYSASTLGLFSVPASITVGVFSLPDEFFRSLEF